MCLFFFFFTRDLRKLSPSDRQCYFSDEKPEIPGLDQSEQVHPVHKNYSQVSVCVCVSLSLFSSYF